MSLATLLCGVFVGFFAFVAFDMMAAGNDAESGNDEEHMDSASPDGKKKHMDPASSKSPRRIVIILRDAADLDPRPTTIVLRC
uniref:Uncharacterized protein n=1 Tax=Globodera rostochiensis TaxID=31243 RepID=A0A914HSX1_GLORO